MTPEQQAAIRRRHFVVGKDSFEEGCIYCGPGWPCDAIQALTALAQIQLLLGDADGSYKILLDKYQQLRARMAKLEAGTNADGAAS